jgi:hypothetical protein
MHEELVAGQGMYWQLLNAQSRPGTRQPRPAGGPRDPDPG